MIRYIDLKINLQITGEKKSALDGADLLDTNLDIDSNEFPN